MPTQRTIVTDVDDQILQCGTRFSDRFVYSNYYVPLPVYFDDERTAILPHYKKKQLTSWINRRLLDPEHMARILPEQVWDDLVKKNHIATDEPIGKGNPVNDERPDESLVHAIRSATNEVRELVSVVGSKIAANDRGLVRIIEKKLGQIELTVEDSNGAALAPATSDANAHAFGAAPQIGPIITNVPTQDQAESLLNELKTDVGYLFLDRTRIRPTGFAIGEHIYTLSLAPGEEIVLEQKAFTKRQMTLEDQTEAERQFDLELSSTLSTELQEGIERQENLSDSWGFNASHTGQYGTPPSNWGQINASHTIGYTKNVTDASQQTGKRSVKDSQTASSKVAAKYRALHKTTFKISSEESFESTSKRVLKNPNKYTPVQLHYFKVMRVLEMMQERYGVRLCWTPSVKDPAFAFEEQIRKGKARILEAAVAALPPKPVKPQPPTEPDKPPAMTMWSWSPEIEADNWKDYSMRADYTLEVPIASNQEWDHDVDAVKQSLKVRMSGPISRDQVNAEVVGTPWLGADTLMVKVHVGVPFDLHIRHIFIQVGARMFIVQPLPDKSEEAVAAYNDALAAYQTQLKEWNDKAAAAMADAAKQAEFWEQQMLQKLNPVAEMINCIIQQQFPPAVRGQCWEIDLWQRLFDWERASYTVYPSWWSDLPMRDPTKEATDFLNASWAKLYLPVRPGMERMALRWIFAKAVAAPVDPEMERRFGVIEKDIDEYRKSTFGSEVEIPELTEECVEVKEKYYCLGHWTELAPTDGTHIEVIQSATSTVDTYTTQDLNDTAALRGAVLDDRRVNIKLKEKAVTIMADPAVVKVVVRPDGAEPTLT